jgi:hypothetical protein
MSTVTATPDSRTFCITISEAEAYVLMKILTRITSTSGTNLFYVYSVLEDLEPRNLGGLRVQVNTATGNIDVVEEA